MRKKRWIILATVVLAVALLCGLAVMTQGAPAEDPMVTLSYLNQNFKTEIMTAAEQYGQTAGTSLENTLKGHISAFTAKLTAPTIPNAAVSAYETVNLASGQTYAVPANAQILMVSGTAMISAAAVSDTTAGTAVAKGGTLQANHLYIATADFELTATADAVLLIK